MISVIIPSRNRFSYIQDLLYDLVKQEIPVDEIIVVDQSDKPYDEFDNCRVFHIVDSKRGPCHARNVGLESCIGEIIVFLDDDIRIDPDFLQNLCSPIIQGETFVVAGAICDKEGNYPNGEMRSWRKEYSNWLLALTANPDFPGRNPTISFPTGCSAIHRSVFEKVGGFDEFFDPDGAGEDREYALRIFQAGFPILYEGKAFIRHLGAPSGGRRGSNSGNKYLNALQANSVYIVAKYFSWVVFEQFCDSWLKAIRHRSINGIRAIWQNMKYYKEAKEKISRIREIKTSFDW